MKLLKIEEILSEERFQLTEANKQCSLKRNNSNLSCSNLRRKMCQFTKPFKRNLGCKYFYLKSQKQIASIFLYRYWVNNLLSEDQFQKDMLAMAAVFLSCKINCAQKETSYFFYFYKQIDQKNNLYLSENEFREKLVHFEMQILICNKFDLDLKLPFNLITKTKEILIHQDKDIILLKAEYFLNDMFRSYVCVCFPPNELFAAALFMSCLYLKFDLTINDISPEIKFSQESSIDQFPYETLYAASLEKIKQIATLTYKFLKVIKI